MLLSRKNFIFVHVYKNAGTSVKEALKPFAANSVERWLTRAHLIPRPRWEIDHDHPTALQVRQRVGADVWDSCFKFAIVRNPWDWLTSLYEYIRRRPQHELHETLIKLDCFQAYIAEVCLGDVPLFQQQQDFVCDDSGHVIVDYVARFETISREWNTITRMIGINCSLPHVNVSKSRDYRTYYSDRSVDLVAEKFQSDIERFGYRFSCAPSVDPAVPVLC